MKIYPDLLDNPNGDPRITQQQYEDWKREQEKMEKKKLNKISGDEDAYSKLYQDY